MRSRIDRKARLVASAFVVFAGIMLSGCSDEKNRPDSHEPSPTPAIATPTATASTASAEDLARPEILAAYADGEALFERVQRKGGITDENVGNTLTGRARGLWTQVGLNYEQQQLRLEGPITRTPKVESIDLEAQPPVSTVTDCLDVSQARVVDAKSGRPRGTPPTPRYPRTVSLVKMNGHWMTSDLVEDRDVSC